MPAVSTQLDGFAPYRSPAKTAAGGFWSRLLKQIQDARMAEAERQVAMFIEKRGSRITDTIEREIERHFV